MHSSKKLLPLATQGLRGFASSDVAVAKSSASGDSFFSKVLGMHKRVDVPLNQALPGVVLMPKTEQPTSVAETKVTTLSNGVRIASENTPGVSSNIGIYVDAGSVYEGSGSHGLSHLMQHMGFKATKNRQEL